jgi:hypothetical protein
MKGLKSKTGYILLNSLPKEERSYEICFETIKLSKMELKYVPHKHKTIEMIKLIKHFNGVIKYIPYELKTYEICLDAVKRNEYDLQYVPRKFKTKELCLYAVKISKYALRYVPKKILTKDFFELIKIDYEIGIEMYEKSKKN